MSQSKIPQNQFVFCSKSACVQQLSLCLHILDSPPERPRVKDEKQRLHNIEQLGTVMGDSYRPQVISLSTSISLL